MSTVNSAKTPLLTEPQIWPFTLYGTKTIFNLQLFRFWVVASLIWGFMSACICVFLPLWESRLAMLHITRAMLGRKDAAKNVGM